MTRAKSDRPGLSGARAWVLCAAILGCAAPSGTTTAPTPEAAAADDERLLSSIRQLTFAGRRSGEGYFAKSGDSLIFQSERLAENPFYQIYLLGLQDGDLRRISTGVGKTTCGFVHPGGRRFLFASTHSSEGAEASQAEELRRREEGPPRRYEWDYDPEFEIYTRDLGDDDSLGSPRVLAPARGYDAEGAYSPDGRWIVFASNRHAYDPIYASAFTAEEKERLELDPSYFIDLYVMDGNGRELRRLTTSAGYDGGPFFSPNGERVVWRRFSEDGATAEIMTAVLDGTDERQITRLEAMSWAPFYHPSGDYVVFATNLHGFDNFELYAVDALGESEPVRVTDSERFDGLPSFSPDGRTLSWTSQRGAGGRSQIFTASWNDAEARRLLGLPQLRAGRGRTLLPVPKGTHSSIEAPDLRAHVEALADPVTEGRRTGTRGGRIATGYVARVFRQLGLEPAGDHGTYFEEFEFTAGVSLGDANRLVVEGAPAPPSEPGAEGADPWPVEVAWQPLSFSKVGEIPPSPVVFAGYGLRAPEGPDSEAIDSYESLDVTDRWVLVLRGSPPNLSKAARRYLRRYVSLRHKAMIARDAGALGIVFAAGPSMPVRRELVPLDLDASLAGSSLVSLTIAEDLTETLLSPDGRTLEQLEVAESGFEIPGLRLGATIDLRQQRRTGRNVLGRLRIAAEPTAEAVALGAHVDHLGKGRSNSSLSMSEDPEQIHPGADDNASGVAAILEIAQSLAAQRDAGALESRRDLLFAAWSGEELGLLGSSHFVERTFTTPHGPHPIVAYLNLDMVGRLDGELSMYGTGSSPIWPREIERHNAGIALPVQARDDSYLPTDATAFYLKGVPILSAFTGAHEDYHKPSDTPDRLDYEGLRDTARLVEAIAVSVAAAEEPPEHLATAAPRNAGARAGIGVYLGTIPDYANTDVDGVRLSGVSKEGPAAQGGLRAGDVIVSVDGRKIENVYDYTYALGDLEAGEAAMIGVLRDGETLELEVVPESRQ